MAVVVAGDLGRSPRMQYHALALAGTGVAVDLVGLAGAPLLPQIAQHPDIRCWRIGKEPAAASRPWGVASAFLRMARTFFGLLHTLGIRIPRPDLMIVQSPPAWPTLPVAHLVASVRGFPFVVDWHNSTFSLLALRLPPGHPLVEATARFERRAGARGNAHLCVSRAMHRVLEDEWGLEPVRVLYDRPASFFRRDRDPNRDDLRRHLYELAGIPKDWADSPGRPLLAISSTSWTRDEDFSLLLRTMEQCEGQLTANSPEPAGAAPAILFLITGKGDGKESFERQLTAMAQRRVAARTVWLSPDDYARLLTCADVGVCLHRSTSGLDLPMKLADMRGSGVPVCTFDYAPCLREVIRPEESDLFFTNASELAALLIRLVGATSAGREELDRRRRWLEEHRGINWEDGWREEALPLLRGVEANFK